MTDQDKDMMVGDQPDEEVRQVRFPELAELEEKIQRRLRSNQKFLERFLDEDFNDLDDEDAGVALEEDDPDQHEEL